MLVIPRNFFSLQASSRGLSFIPECVNLLESCVLCSTHSHTCTCCRYNIRYGRVAASDEEVEDAARAADIHDRIVTFTDGQYV